MSGRSWDEMKGIADKVRALSADGTRTVASIALELGVSARTVERHRRRLGVAAEPARQATPDDVAWLNRARDEGMPATWIGETIGLSRDAVQRRRPMPPGARREWLAAWSDIRRHPTLLALHREFAAPTDGVKAAA